MIEALDESLLNVAGEGAFLVEEGRDNG